MVFPWKKRKLSKMAKAGIVATKHNTLGEDESHARQHEHQEFLRIQYTVLSQYYVEANLSIQHLLSLDVTAASSIILLTSIFLSGLHEWLISSVIAIVLDLLILSIGAFSFRQIHFSKLQASIYSSKLDKLACYLANYNNKINQSNTNELIYIVNEPLLMRMASQKNKNNKIASSRVLKLVKKFIGDAKNTRHSAYEALMALANSLAIIVLFGLLSIDIKSLIFIRSTHKLPPQTTVFDVFTAAIGIQGFYAFIFLFVLLVIHLWFEIRAINKRCDEAIKLFGSIEQWHLLSSGNAQSNTSQSVKQA